MLLLSRSIVRWYVIKSEISRLLLLSVIFSLAMLTLRIAYTGSIYFAGLAWNLFLAYIPYAISQLVSNRPALIGSTWKMVVLAVGWMLFLPNSFYILTDLFHLQERSEVPLWFNLLLILTFAWNGLLMGVLSVRQVEKIILLRYGIGNELLVIYPIMWLNALGIFIGRYWRYNTWDIIVDPINLLSDCIDLSIHPVKYMFSWAMIFSYSFFMTLLYLMLKRISRLVW